VNSQGHRPRNNYAVPLGVEMKVLIHKGILLDFSQFIYLDIHVVKSDIHD
jgi:hypothetical protein